jgi:hypothetical protein
MPFPSISFLWQVFKDPHELMKCNIYILIAIQISISPHNPNTVVSNFINGGEEMDKAALPGTPTTHVPPSVPKGVPPGVPGGTPGGVPKDQVPVLTVPVDEIPEVNQEELIPKQEHLVLVKEYNELLEKNIRLYRERDSNFDKPLTVLLREYRHLKREENKRYKMC